MRLRHRWRRRDGRRRCRKSDGAPDLEPTPSRRSYRLAGPLVVGDPDAAELLELDFRCQWTS